MLMPSKKLIYTLAALAIAASAAINNFYSSPPAPPQQIPTGAFTVSKIIDGDTLDVKLPHGATERVRLIGIDTPESVDPRRPVQCFGYEASAYLKKLIGTQPVYIERDALSDDRDKYGRLLRYIFLPDNTFVNEKMVADGYAYAYTRFAFTFKTSFVAAQRDARAGSRGLWSVNSCAGRR